MITNEFNHISAESETDKLALINPLEIFTEEPKINKLIINFTFDIFKVKIKVN